jgi:hypothetical protein
MTKKQRLTSLFLFGIVASPAVTYSAQFEFVPGSSKKISQLIGDVDLQFGTPTISQTLTRAGVSGTDLGFSFEHNGKLYFLFGDTQPGPNLNREKDADSIASADVTARPHGCIDLNFVLDPKDGGYHPPRIPHIANSGWDVPAGGVSADGKMYVFFTTDHSAEVTMGRSVVGVSSDNGYSFKKAYDFSSIHFINVAPVKIQDDVLLFGTGDYRKSDPYLAKTSQTDLKNKSSLRYFAGLDAQGKPLWSQQEKDSAPLFDEPCLGELSVNFDQPTSKWLMTYNCPNTFDSSIQLRTANAPWGPWTEPQMIFNPVRDQGLCFFMHRHVDDTHPACDNLSFAADDSGWAYAPYMIPSLFETHDNVRTIYYTMSTWDPYRVVLMKTDFKLSK